MDAWSAATLVSTRGGKAKRARTPVTSSASRLRSTSAFLRRDAVIALARRGSLFQLDLDHAHRRLVRIRDLVRHVRFAESDASRLEFRCLRRLAGLGEGQRPGGQNDADVRELVRVQSSLLHARRKRDVSNTDAIVLEYDFDRVLRRLWATVREGGPASERDGRHDRAGRYPCEERHSPTVHRSPPGASYKPSRVACLAIAAAQCSELRPRRRVIGQSTA